MSHPAKPSAKHTFVFTVVNKVEKGIAASGQDCATVMMHDDLAKAWLPISRVA